MNVKDQQVFVVEDQAEVGRLVCRALEDHGYKTEMFVRAGDFQRRIKTRRPNLCIIDLGLPDGSGLEVLRSLRLVRPETVSVVTTVMGDDAHIVAALSAGADGYLRLWKSPSG